MGEKEIQPGNQPATNSEEGRRPTYGEKIQKILIELGQKAPKTPVNHRSIAEKLHCTRQRVSQAHQETKETTANTIPPKQPPHRPEGAINRKNQPIVQELKQRIKDPTPRKQIAAQVAHQLGLGPQGTNQVQHQIARMIGTGEFPRRKATHLTGEKRTGVRNQLVALVKAGHTNVEIADGLEISGIQVRNLRREARTEGQLSQGQRGKRRKKGR